MIPRLHVQGDIESARRQFKGKERQINLAAARAINRALESGRSVATKEIARITGIRPQRAIRDRLHLHRATPDRLIGEIGAERYTPNLMRYNARQTKKGVSASAWGKRKTYRGTFIGNQGRTVFKRTGKARNPIRPVWGPRLAKAFVETQVRKALALVARSRFATEFAREIKRRVR